MYESWFRFRRRPFLAAPRSEDYFPSESSEHARKTIISCVQRAAGPALLIGGPGSGKTTSCLQFLSHFRTRTLVGFIPCTGIASRRSFFQNILFELGRPYRDLDEGELRLSLVEYLTSSEIPHEGTVLVFDDAHELSLEQFEDLSVLGGLLRDNNHCVHLILSGAVRLEEMLSTTNLESFNQRVAARCYLESFRIQETEAYIRRQFDRANAMADEVFIHDALPTIHNCTGGTPRLINQLCDHALVLAAAGGHTQLDENGLKEAWSDLQQLPPPETSTPKLAIEDVVEFGALEDECLDESERPSPAEMKTQDEIPDDEICVGAASNDEASDATQVAATSDAEQRLEDILDHLDDYQSLPYPGIDIGRDPFAEVFAREEVVINRPASMLNRLADRQPEVVSDFGQDLIATLDQLMFANVAADKRRDAESSPSPPPYDTEQPRLVVAAETFESPVTDESSVLEQTAAARHSSSDPDWGSRPELQEALDEPAVTHGKVPSVVFVPDSPLDSGFSPQQDVYLADHPESGGCHIDVNYESPFVETDALVHFVPRTTDLEPAVSAQATDDVADPSDVGPSPAEGDRREAAGPRSPEVVTITASSPTIEARSEISVDDFAEAIPREIQEPLPATVRVVEVNRDDEDPSQPRRRFKQLFSDLKGR